MAPSQEHFTWTDEQESMLIDSIRENRNIWDHKHPLYLKNVLKTKTFDKIQENMRLAWPDSGEQFSTKNLKNKYKNLRTYYIKEKNKVKKIRSGSPGAAFTPKWRKFNQLSFLDEVNEAEESENNLSTSFSSVELQNLDGMPESPGTPESPLDAATRSVLENFSSRSNVTPSSEMDKISAAISAASAAIQTSNRPPSILDAFGELVVKQLERFTDVRKRDETMQEITNILHKNLYSE